MELTVLHHQNLMLALRQAMGWPLFKPANDSIAFSAGREVDFETGMELARIAQMMGKDLVYSGWADTRVKDPTTFCVAYREMLTVDIVDRLVPFAANDDAPIILVSTKADEFFMIDKRGSLLRVEGKPKGIGKGRKLAMKRIKAAAAEMSDKPLTGNRFVPTGGDWIAPAAPVETVVRFG